MFIQLDRTAVFASIGFVLALAAFEWVVFVGYRSYILTDLKHVYAITQTNKFLVLSIVVYVAWLFAISAYVYLSLIAHRSARILYFFPFALAVAFEYAYQNLFDRFSTIQDLSLVFITTPTQQLGAVSSYFSLVTLLPCLAYLILLIAFKSRTKLRSSILAFVSLVLIVGSINLSVWMLAPKFFVVDSVAISVGATDRSFFGYAFSRFLTYQIERETVPKVNIQHPPTNNVVFILDESVVAGHLSLNGYQRPTTPFLDGLERDGLLKNYGTAISASTRSLESLRLLMTGLNHEDVADLELRIDKYPTIFQYAKSMGYKTTYFDGQINLFWGGKPDDVKFVDQFVNVDHVNRNKDRDYDNDNKIATSINEIISGSTGNFIFVFKRGNHAPYETNFPAGSVVWSPSAPDSSYVLGAADREVLINTYDNAIKYNVDSFFISLSSDYRHLPNDTVFVYTSDHGQTLGEYGEQYSHGGKTLNEAKVPLFVIGNTTGKLDTTYKAGHSNIFATLLDLMQFPKEQRVHRYGVSLFEATGESSADRFFIVPDLAKKEVVRVPLE